jgi:phage terminase large subunit-like protein
MLTPRPRLSQRNGGVVKVEELRSLAKVAVDYPNYQHKGMSESAMDELAMKSFSKLTAEQRDKVVNVCTEYEIFDATNPDTLKEIMRWRFLCQTNLFFLCKVLEKYKDTSLKEYLWIDGTTHNTHEEICNGFFVHKDPTKKSFKVFANEYTDVKERLLLVPRGGFKSSMDMADTVQWIICYPEVTILILTGVLDLAKDFVKEIKGHFELEDAAAGQVNLFHAKQALKPRTTHDGTPSLFQVLFPEHCIPKEEGKSYEYQTPAISIVDKECTVFAASIEQNLAGWHVGVMKLDDVVTNENSRTVERIKNINKQVSINNAMLHPYGFYDKIGTWYDAEDTYGQDIKHVAKCKKDGEDITMKIYLRPAWWPNEAARKAGKVESEMQESDWEFWFNEPGQLTYKFLRGKKSSDPEGFAIKYLNDPTQAHRIKFPRELMIRRTIPATMLPQQGMIVVTVDTAYSTKNWADYTVVLTSLIYGGRFYVIDMKRGRFNEYELPQIIAANALQWKPKRICIEDSVGVKWLGKEIYREMDKLRIRVPIEFVPLGQGSKGNAKEQKAKPVLRYLGDERLLFTNQCVGLDDIYNELEKFGTAGATHDDIVSALSILVEQFASYADMEGRTTSASMSFVPNQGTKMQYDLVYGEGVFGKVFTQKSWATAQDNPEMSNAEAYQTQVSAQQADIDPLADLF